METKRPSKAPLLGSVVVIVILAAAFGYYYVTASAQISSLNSSISSQSSLIGAQSGTIQSQSSGIASLQANATAFRALVATLRTMIATDKAAIATLTSKLTAANATIATNKATIASLNSQITTANAIIANLTTTVNLQASKTLVNGVSVTEYGSTHRSSTPFVTFSPKYAGYVLISVSSATQSWYINATAKPSNSNSGGAVEQIWSFLAPSSPTNIYYSIIAVSPGTLNTLAILAGGAVDGTATVTATYYY